MDELKVKFDKKKTLITGIIIAILGLYFFSQNKENKKNFEELALGKDATVEFGTVDNYKIHCQDTRDINECISSYFNHGENLPVTLWLGNSQLHAINQFKVGDKPSSVKLHKLLKKQKQFLITFSQPNANLQEHLVLLSHLIQKLPVKNLILPIVFDDMREINIRSQIKNIFEYEETKNFLTQSSKVGKRLYKNFLLTKENSGEKNSNDPSLQERSEKFLNKKLEKIWPIWMNRSNLRGDLFNELYQIRNYIFKINPSSTRSMIPGYYLKNFQALEDLLSISNSNGLKVLVYIVPIRDDYKIPYHIDEYKNFKKDIKDLSIKKDIQFINLEKTVPNSFWGEKNSTSVINKKEIDFMHFKAEGHDFLAEAIYQQIIRLKKK